MKAKGVCNVYRYKCNNKENDDEGVLLYMIKLQCLLVPVVVDICFFSGKKCPCHAWLVDGVMDMDKDNG